MKGGRKITDFHYKETEEGGPVLGETTYRNKKVLSC